MKLSGILVLFALIATVEGQWAAAARGLYQPILLSVGTVFTVINSINKDESEDKSIYTSAQNKEREEEIKAREEEIKQRYNTIDNQV